MATHYASHPVMNKQQLIIHLHPVMNKWQLLMCLHPLTTKWQLIMSSPFDKKSFCSLKIPHMLAFFGSFFLSTNHGRRFASPLSHTWLIQNEVFPCPYHLVMIERSEERDCLSFHYSAYYYSQLWPESHTSFPHNPVNVLGCHIFLSQYHEEELLVMVPWQPNILLNMWIISCICIFIADIWWLGYCKSLQIISTFLSIFAILFNLILMQVLLVRKSQQVLKRIFKFIIFTLLHMFQLPRNSSDILRKIVLGKVYISLKLVCFVFL